MKSKLCIFKDLITFQAQASTLVCKLTVVSDPNSMSMQVPSASVSVLSKFSCTPVYDRNCGLKQVIAQTNTTSITGGSTIHKTTKLILNHW